MSVVLVIPDLHLPFAAKGYLKFLAAQKKLYRPNKIVCLGDEVDYHSLSRYDHDPDGMSPGDEHNASVDALQPLYKLFPNVRCCTSNHTVRPLKKAFQSGIPKAFMKDYKDFLKAPRGWDWAESFVIDGVRYIHGEGCSGPTGFLKRAQALGQSVVGGHLHAHAGILYHVTNDKLIFGFNVGCLIDETKYAFAYAKHMSSKPVLGCGIIINGVPRFIPMEIK